MNRSPTRRTRGGFTLMELMISSMLSVLVITSLMAVFVQQRKSYKAMAEMSDMVQNVRFAMNQVARDVRMAGYGLAVSPSKVATWITWVSGVTNVITRVNGSSGAPDTLHIVTALDAPVAYLSASTTVGAIALQLQAGQGAQFNTSSKKVLYIDKIETARVTGVAGDTLTVSRDPTVNGLGLRNGYPAGAPVELVKVITYSWSNDTTTYPYTPHLRRDDNLGTFTYSWQKMTAGNIEDFQVDVLGVTNRITLTGRTSEPDAMYIHPTRGDRYRRFTLVSDLARRSTVKR